MKIKETIERDCCHPQKDLKTYFGKLKDNNRRKFMFCTYCGQIWMWDRQSDAAGSTESVLVKMEI